METITNVLSALNFESTTFMLQFALFMVLHWTLKFVIYNPLVEVRNKRDRDIAERLAAAEKMAAEARAMKESYDQSLREVRKIAQAELAERTSQAEKKRTQLVSAARDEARSFLDEARSEVDKQRQQAMAKLDEQVGELSFKVGARLLEGALDPARAAEAVTRLRSVS
ncbi:MAG: F0F1 ATP synthase subunit B [Armatimonadetes bacterium]|nr:F0F1 ATP synthase subunit B [Armatimonadota bacterium]